MEKNKKIHIPIHLDIGNRGCEGISKGTIEILASYNVLLYSRNYELDKTIGKFEDNLLSVGRPNPFDSMCYKLSEMFFRKNYQLQKFFETKIELPDFFRNLKKEKKGIVLVTGGDLFCYGNHYAVFINRYINSNKFKTVLWGCSIGRENLTQEKMKSIKKFNYIVARESITYEMLNEVLDENNVFCYPDPAFVLKAERWDYKIPNCDGGTVGINLSNFVGKDVGENTLYASNIEELIDFILEETYFNILLLPHVYWKGQDDRIECEKIYRKYKDSSRIYYFDKKVNYCQIRYVIGQCRFFIGARTHAMISAYAMCVPSLALGYSVKSKGIAKDIGLQERLVVDFDKLTSKNDIKYAFIYLIENEASIREHLKITMPAYIENAYNAKKIIDKISIDYI